MQIPLHLQLIIVISTVYLCTFVYRRCQLPETVAYKVYMPDRMVFSLSRGSRDSRSGQTGWQHMSPWASDVTPCKHTFWILLSYGGQSRQRPRTASAIFEHRISIRSFDNERPQINLEIRYDLHGYPAW